MNKHDHIAISLFRVSTDSKYLDMIFSCPAEYYFTSLSLEVRFLDPEDKIMKSSYFDLSPALFPNESYKTSCVARLPLDKIGVQVPAIYKGTIKAIEREAQGDNEAKQIVDHMVCSDVNLAYRCMLKDLLDMDNLASDCVEISDEAIRKYLLLYGHQSALATGDDEVAERFFKLIINCFDLCGKSYGCGCNRPRPKNTNNCNCGR